jgi:putative phage-type endonuclease
MNITEHTAPQRSPEWHQARRGRLTGSMVGAVLGLSPNLTREGALRRMVRDYHGAEPEFAGNVATEYGINHESLALVDFRMQTGLEVKACGFFSADLDGIPIGASPDGIVDNQPALVEIKCPFGLCNDKQPTFKLALDQPHYLAQMKMQMLLTGAERTYFVQWNTHAMDITIVPFDRDWWPSVRDQLAAFWADYQAALLEPKPHLEALRKVIDTPEARKLLAEYDECLEQIERATERKREIMERFEGMTDGRNSIIAGRLMTKTSKAGSIAYAAIVKEWAESLDVEPYRGKPVQYWTLK